MLGQATVAVLAVLVITGECSSGMICSTITAMPRRSTMLVAKAAVVTAVGLAAGTIAVLGSVLAGRFILPGVLYVIPILGNLIADPRWERRIQRYAPTKAGLAIQATRNLSKLPIGPWAGLGVLAAWAAVALLAGGLLLRLRDA